MAKQVTPPSSEYKKPASMYEEVGVRLAKNTSLQSGYTSEEKRIDDTTIADYRKMRLNDGKVAAITKLYTLPILSTNFEIIGDEADSGEAEFIEQNFTSSRDRGGMSMPMKWTIEDMAFAPFDGFRSYEKIWYEYAGQIRLKKLAPRDPITITVKTDENGGFDGFKQATGMKDVDIPKEKALLVTWDKIDDPYYGTSILKPVWYHWDKKHKLYYIAHVAAEVQTIPIRVIKHKGMDSDSLANLEFAVDRLGTESRLTYNMDAAEVELLDTTGTTKVDIKQLIDHHDSQISKALLTMWVDLSSEGGSTGSRALADPQIDIYFQSVESLMTLIEQSINDFVIPQLIAWNYSGASLPTFKFQPIRKDAKLLIREAFMELIKQNKTSGKFNAEVIDKVADDLDVEFDLDEYNKEEDEKEKESQKLQARLESAPVAPVQTEIKPQNIENMSEKDIVSLAEEQPSRIDLQDIAAWIPRQLRRMEIAQSDILDKSKQALIKRITMLVANKNVQALNNLQFPNSDEYIKAVTTAVKNTYQYGQTKAADEMGVNMPRIEKEALSIMQAKAKQTSDKQLQDLIFLLTSLGLIGIERNMSEAQIGTAIESIFSKFITQSLPKGNNSLVFDFFNSGRNDVFLKNEDGIVAMKYNNSLENVMRGVVCPYCRALNGMTVEITDGAFHRYMPPQHFNCACVWEPVLPGDKYKMTGEPTSLPTFDSINDFSQIGKSDANEARKELGLPKLQFAERKKKEDPVQKQIEKLAKEQENIKKHNDRVVLELKEEIKRKEQDEVDLCELIYEQSLFGRKDIKENTEK